MEIIDVVNKLIGPIEPVGETREDERRYNNLVTITDLVWDLLQEIHETSKFVSRYEYSMKHAGNKAAMFLREVKGEFFTE